MFAQLIVSGISMGSLYALIAIAMVIVYKTSEVPNFAQGEMAMISTFVAYSFLSTYEWGFVWSFVGALVFAAVLGVYIAGGIAPRYYQQMLQSDFRCRFEHKQGYEHYMQKIATAIIIHDYPGLLGAGSYLHRHLTYPI